MEKTLVEQDVFGLAHEAVAAALALEPELQAVAIAERVVERSGAEFLGMLGRQLVINHLASLVRSERFRQARQVHLAQWSLFPELATHSKSFRRADGARVFTDEARLPDLRSYLKLLNAGDRDRHGSNPKIQWAKAAIKLMERYARKQRKINFAGAVALEAERKKAK